MMEECLKERECWEELQKRECRVRKASVSSMQATQRESRLPEETYRDPMLELLGDNMPPRGNSSPVLVYCLAFRHHQSPHTGTAYFPHGGTSVAYIY